MAVDINGDGLINLGGTSTTQGRLRLSEDTDNGTNYVELQAPASLASNLTFTLPSADGTSGQVLQTNGSGALSFGSGGFSGATINAPSASVLTLTSTSTQYQKVQSTSTTNNVVNLPDATTLSAKGTAPFVIENRGLRSQPLLVKNNSGSIVGSVSSGAIGSCSLVDNSTAAGVWSISTDNVDQLMVSDTTSLTTTSLGGSGAQEMWRPLVLGLTSTKFIIYYATFSSNTATLRFKVGDISGSTITYGSEQTTTQSITANQVEFGGVRMIAYRLSDSSFVVLFGWMLRTPVACANDSYTAGANVRTCTVSGTTITFGSPSALSFPTYNSNAANSQRAARSCAQNGDIVRMADDKFAVFYNTGVTTSYNNPLNYSGSLTCNIITVSGTTQTVGTKVDLGTSTYTRVLSAACYDTDKLLVCYAQAGSAGASTGRSKLVVVTVSGTTPTWNTPVSIQSSDTDCFFGDGQAIYAGFAFPLSTSKCFVPYIDIAGKSAIVSISTTTPSVDFSASTTGILGYSRVSIISPNVIYYPGAWYIYVTTDGFYVTPYVESGGSYTHSTSALPYSGSTNIVTINETVANGGTLATLLATSAFNS